MKQKQLISELDVSMTYTLDIFKYNITFQSGTIKERKSVSIKSTVHNSVPCMTVGDRQ